MQWDDLLARLRDAGIEFTEREFLDDYGQYAARDDARLRGRYFRCTYGQAATGGTTLEAYAFASESEATDFLELMRDGSSRWARFRNMVLRAPTDAGDTLRSILELL